MCIIVFDDKNRAFHRFRASERNKKSENVPNIVRQQRQYHNNSTVRARTTITVQVCEIFSKNLVFHLNAHAIRTYRFLF